MTDADKEGLRQQMLLRALLGDARPGVVTGWLQPRQVQRGLAAYRAHAGALAERALAAAYPTLQQLLGAESFAALARDFWRRQPPESGDLARWGDALPAFIAAADTLADEPFLPDMARLEWALHRVQTAADAPPQAPSGLEMLATHDPAALRLQLPAGSVLLSSRWPVASLWQAHRSSAENRFDAVRHALAEGRGEDVWVTRSGWAPQVLAVPAAEARFITALLARQSLALALTEALQEPGAPFDFEAWLVAALQARRLVAVTAVTTATDLDTTPT